MKWFFKRAWTLIQHSAQGFIGDAGTQLAAAISYYVLFSIFPLAIVATSIAAFVLQDAGAREELIDAVLDAFPLSEDEGRQDLTEIIEGATEGSSGAFGLVGLLSLLWSASAVFGTVRRSLNAIYNTQAKRPLVRQKLTDFAMMFGLGVFFLASIVATAMLQAARDVTNDIPGISALAEATGPAWMVIAFVLPIFLSFVAFSVLYWAVPAAKSRWRDVAVGAAFAAIGFEALKVGFSIYVTNFGNYDVVFGSLATVVIFLFWVFLASNIMLFGAELASQFPRVMRGEYDKEPDPNAPPVPLRTRVWRVARSLVFHDEPESVERRRSGDRTS